MKRILSIILAFVSINVFAQTITEDFESNSLGWNESVGKKGEAIIKDGALHLSAGAGLEGGRSFIATCYLPIDSSKNFSIKATCTNTKINDEDHGICLIINYMDDYNYDEFIITKELAIYKRWIDGKPVGFRQSQIKVDKKSKDHIIEIISTLNKLEFIVDNMKCLELRYAPLHYSGFGVGVWAADGKQVADIDQIEIIQ